MPDFALLDAIDAAYARTTTKREYKALDRLFMGVPAPTRRAWLRVRLAEL